jgi:molybdopterin molybdotransferase
MDGPGHTNSAMDGYALSGEDRPETTPRRYTVTGTAFAGQPYHDRCNAGQCVRIMTGAAMPAGLDTVVMQEHTEKLSDAEVLIPPGQRPRQNVRLAGEDISRNSVVLRKGRSLQAADLGVLASIGIGEIDVYRRPRVAFFSTGDELRPVGDTLGAGDIYDSNRYSLFGMLSQLNVDIDDLGIVRDNPGDLTQAFEQASNNADLVITTGGVSVGEADHVKQIIDTLGEIRFWKIAMKPGRPLAFGQIGQAAFFGLPGNPVSVMTTFYHFVLPAIQRLAGRTGYRPLTIDAVCTSGLKKRPGRFEFQRGVLSRDDSGRLSVSVTGKQGSGILTSMSLANCLILLDEDCEGVKAGDMVTVQPITTCF